MNQERMEIIGYESSQMAAENLADWQVQLTDGTSTGSWSKLAFPRYGEIKHLVVKKENEEKFDKISVEWKPAVFVVIWRNNNGERQYYIPKEERMLLVNSDGTRGGVELLNIVQGMIKKDESEEEAARREVKEESGLVLKNIRKVQDLYFDAANSPSASPFFLAEAESTSDYLQELDKSENISAGEGNWYSEADINNLIRDYKIQCAKTLAGLMLAAAFLTPEDVD